MTGSFVQPTPAADVFLNERVCFGGRFMARAEAVRLSVESDGWSGLASAMQLPHAPVLEAHFTGRDAQGFPVFSPAILDWNWPSPGEVRV